MADERPTLEVGRVVKAHGLKGQLLVDLWSDRAERLDPGARLETARGLLTVASAQRHRDGYLVSFDGVTTRDEADRWRGVVLSAEGLDVDGALWIDELFGAEVVDARGVTRGVVTGVEANPASDLLVLDSGALVPLTFVTDVVAHVRVTVDVPEGLFE
ncbi:MAG: ribosome maturation factor RimM [Acidimicrobiales bacterium]